MVQKLYFWHWKCNYLALIAGIKFGLKSQPSGKKAKVKKVVSCRSLDPALIPWFFYYCSVFFKGYWLGSMLVFIKQGELKQYNFIITSNIIGQYTFILTKNAQELTPYRFGFKCDTNRIRKYFLSELRFEPRSLGWTTTDALANSDRLTCRCSTNTVQCLGCVCVIFHR
jgi:hypothetical protein